MKKHLLILVSILCLLCAQAVGATDFRIKGRWVGLMEYGENHKFSRGGNLVGSPNNYGGMDKFNMQQRWRIQLDAVTSEHLAGTVFFEIGSHRWGQAATGGAMGADATNVVKVKNAYLDWDIPQTNMQMRLGIQRLAMPGAVSQSRVMGADVAAVVVSRPFGDVAAASLFWARPYNDNFVGEDQSGTRQGFMDNMDLVGLSLDLNFDGLQLTPWIVGGGIGPNTLRTGYGSQENFFGFRAQNAYFENGMLPIGLGIKSREISGYGTMLWAGLAVNMTKIPSFRLAFDFNYGSIHQQESSASRSGWLALLLAEYEYDWGIPGIVGWYSSGDDANPGNGSERMPTLQRDEAGGDCVAPYAFNGGRPGTLRDSMYGHTMSGLWGVGVRVRDISLIDDLKQTIRINVMGGTNDPDFIDELWRRTGIRMSPNNYGNSMLGMENLYMTRKDYAIEAGLVSNYKIYDNLTLGVDFSYMALFLDKGVWGKSIMNGKDDTVSDSWNATVCLIYEF